jgi:hypothetical protein
MSQMQTAIKSHIEKYPTRARETFHLLYHLVKSSSLGNLNQGLVEESLKWGEPSFRTKYGSPIRIDWKEKSPDVICIYFNCNTILVDTFRLIFADELTFEGKRAIVLNLNDELPMDVLEACIKTALEYKKRRRLPNLGL